MITTVYKDIVRNCTDFPIIKVPQYIYILPTYNILLTAAPPNRIQLEAEMILFRSTIEEFPSLLLP